MTKRLAHWQLQTLLVVLMTGCAYPEIQLDRAGQPIPGPIAIGETRKPIAGTCRHTFMYSGTCDLLFEDLNGRRIDGHQIASELDRTAAAFPLLAKWLKSVEGRKDSELPYDMYLLTISPEIVLVVPRGNDRRKNCPSVYQDGCIQSMAFRAQSYWYQASPDIRPGSFWFSQTTGRLQPIETQEADVVISIDRAVVRLTPAQGRWKVFREK